jgi:outer membrane immunogenic protein
MRSMISVACLLSAASVAAANPAGGFHAGIFVSYGNSGDATLISGANPATQTGFVDTGDVASVIPVDGSNFGGGARVGFDWPLGDKAFIGVEASFNYLGVDETSSRPGPADSSRIMTANVQQEYLATALVRVGYWLSDNMDLHVTGGLAYGDTEMTTALTRIPSCVGNNCQQGTTSETVTGWALGAGAEFALSPTMGLRLDYLHYDLGEQSHLMTDPAFPAFVFAARSEFSGDIVQAGVSWRF